MTPLRWLCFLLLAAAPLAAQDARLRSRLDPSVLTSVQQLVDSAHAAGLPTEPLVQKALEGQSKSASGDRIIGAVRLLFSALREARASLGLGTGTEELVAGAAALRAGASEAALAELRRRRPGDLSVALSVLTDLMARGVTPLAAARAVHALAQQGRSDHDFLLLRTQVEEDIRTGVTPGNALDRRLSGLPAAAPPRQP